MGTDMAGMVEQTWWSHLSAFSLLDISRLEKKEGYTRVITKVPSSFPNVIFGVDLEPEGIGVRIEEALGPFRELGLPANLWLGPSTRPPDLGPLLEAMGLARSLSLKGMHRSLADLPEDRPAPAGLSFREVRDQAALARRVALMSRAYGIEPGFGPLFVEMYAKLGYGPGTAWRHLVGDLDGQPVVAASVQLYPGAAVLHNVGAEPAFRRRGLATAATLAVLELARQEGRERVVLQATGAGARLYQGLGFQECCQLTAHTLAGPDQSGVWREPVAVRPEGDR